MNPGLYWAGEPGLAETPSPLDGTDFLRSVLNSLASGVVVCDRQGKLLYFNSEAERILGVELRAVGPDEWTPTYGCYLPDMLTPYPPERLPLARCLGGEEVLHELVFIRNPQRNQGVWITVSARPFRDPAGAIAGAVGVFRDVTAAQNALRMNGSRHVEQLDGLWGYVERLTLAVEQTADSVMITDARGVIEYVNQAFQETTGYPAAEALGRTPSILKSGHHGEAFYTELWRCLQAGDSYRGTIVNRKKGGDLYLAEQTISPIKDSTNRITHYVSVLKDVTEERKQQEQEFQLGLANAVQQRFYTPTADVPGFDIAGAAYSATSTGGDYFDFIRQDDGSLILAIGDVSGHGFGSALVMAGTRSYLRAFASLESDVGVLLGRINRALASDLDGRQFVTLLLVRLDPRKRSFHYAGAGHVAGYLLDRRGEIRHVLASTGTPLGLFPEQEFSCGPEIILSDGDTLVLPTDGLAETFSPAGNQFGFQRVLDYVRQRPETPARELIEEIHGSAREFAAGLDQQDDITLIIVKVAAGAPAAEAPDWYL